MEDEEFKEYMQHKADATEAVRRLLLGMGHTLAETWHEPEKEVRRANAIVKAYHRGLRAKIEREHYERDRDDDESRDGGDGGDAGT